VDDIVAASAIDAIGAVEAVHGIIATKGEDDIVAGCAIDGVVSICARDHEFGSTKVGGDQSLRAVEPDSKVTVVIGAAVVGVSEDKGIAPVEGVEDIRYAVAGSAERGTSGWRGVKPTEGEVCARHEEGRKQLQRVATVDSGSLEIGYHVQCQ